MAGISPIKLAGPAYLAAAAANIYTPAASPIVTVLTHIHVTNTTGTIRTFQLFIGATGGSTAGTELIRDYSLAVAGTSSSEWHYYGAIKMLSTDFLTGLASAGSALTVIVEGYQYVGI